VIAAIVLGWVALALAVVGVVACASLISGRRIGE
jgi:uncharacterized membrane protein YbaN (DUF454 family)